MVEPKVYAQNVVQGHKIHAGLKQKTVFIEISPLCSIFFKIKVLSGSPVTSQCVTLPLLTVISVS